MAQKKTKKPTKPAPKLAPKKRLQARRHRKHQQKTELAGTRQKISSAFRLFRDSLSLLRQHWKVFGGIALVYLGLFIILVGLNTGQITTLKDNLEQTTGNSQLGISFMLFSDLISSSGGASSESGSVYQSLLVIIVSLAAIWTLRQLLAGHKVSVRDAFYKGMYPLVPVMLVLLVIGLQLIPLMIGTFLYSVVFAGGIAVTAVEQLLWAILVFLLVVTSLYFVTSSIFAFYIATLPDMRPVRALRSARQLVRFRRWTLLRKLLFLPFALLIIGGAITIPIILVWAPLAPWIFALLSAASLVFVHTYIYSLYRELL